ncbi:MAG: hypothetical protein OSJ70_05675 [Bacilli bacterium]|nr:hypothetical protein [Bacilli bacterium]
MIPLKNENSSSELIEMEEDSFFCLLSSEDKYSCFIRKKIEDLENEYDKLSVDEARARFFDIVHDFMIFGSTYDLKLLNPLNFIKKYDFLITDDKLIDVYFSLNNYDVALEFIKLKKEELSKCFKKYYIALFENDSTDDYPISDLDYMLTAEICFGADYEKRKIYSVAGCYKENELKILLYRYFKDDVTFIFYNEEKNFIPLYGYCSNLDWQALEEIFVDLYLKGEYETIKKIIKKGLSYSSNFVPHIEDKKPFNDYKLYGVIFLELIVKLGRTAFTEANIAAMKKQEDFIISTIEPSENLATNVLSNEFLANLKFLKNIPKRELLQHPFYGKVFEVYLVFCRSLYYFDVKKYEFIFKRLFNRLIEGKSLIDMMGISSIESLFHFYKTNEIVNFDDSKKVSVSKINSYITKQYLELKNILINSYKGSREKYELLNPHERISKTMDDAFSIYAIHFISMLGFSNSKKMLEAGLKIEEVSSLANLEYRSDKEREEFLNIIIRDISLLIKNRDNLNVLFKLFRHLKDENYPRITLNKLVKRVMSFEYALLPNVECLKDDLLRLDLVSKGEPIDNKIEGVKLYNDYRLREQSSIPDIEGRYKNLSYSTVDMHSTEIISNGIGNYLYPENKKGSSCLTPAGKASSCLFHGAINPHGRFFKVTINGKIVAYSWLWRAGDVLCFDNIEVTDRALDIPDYETTIMNIYLKAAGDFVKISTREEKNPLKVVVVGKNKIDMLNEPFDGLDKVRDYCANNFRPNNSDNLYLEDSKDTQYVLCGKIDDDLNTEDTNYFYYYQSKKGTSFDEWSWNYLYKLINSIYFDYCLYNNQKYERLTTSYTRGFIGDDWVIGYKEDGSYDLFYRTVNERIFKEISSYLSISIDSLTKNPIIITHDYTGLDYLLDRNNYDINVGELKEYLKNVRDTISSVTKEDFYHTPHSMENFGHIIYDGAITSSAFGQHRGGSGTNGSHFICVAAMDSELFRGLSLNEGFILDKNICAFPTEFNVSSKVDSSIFRDSRYPIRIEGGKGELHVLDYIELNKAKGILINGDNEGNIAKILYILEQRESNLPILIDRNKFYTIDKNELKRLIKLK